MAFVAYNYRPNKYQDQASIYSNTINNEENLLTEAIDNMNTITTNLSFNDKQANDLLTNNVIKSVEETKEEILNIQNDFSNYDSLITAKATKLDEEEKQLYEKYLQQQREKNIEKETQNIKENDTKDTKTNTKTIPDKNNARFKQKAANIL